MKSYGREYVWLIIRNGFCVRVAGTEHRAEVMAEKIKEGDAIVKIQKMAVE